MSNKRHQGYAGRMRTYLSEMYSVPTRLAAAGLLCCGFFALLDRIHLLPVRPASWLTLHGTWAIFALLLVLRLMDELKDRDIDRQLFAHRPLPSGRVRERDITVSLAVMIVLFLAPNWRSPLLLLAAAGVLGYAMLMFRFFFMARVLRRHLLLNLATHNPIIAVLLVYLALMFVTYRDLRWVEVQWSAIIAVILMFWPLGLAWEIARKIRAPEQEDEYVTYSQIFGYRYATLIVGLAQAMTLIVALSWYRALAFPVVVSAIAAAGYGILCAVYVRFVLRPSPAHANLKPWAEAYMLMIWATTFMGAVLS